MEKEILTIENIRYDLRKQLREGLVPVCWGTGFFLLFLVLFILMIRIREPVVFQTGFAVLIILILDIVLAMRVYKPYCALKNPDCIVVDRLARKELKYRPSRSRADDRHYLYFVSYGKYEIPDANYKWSELYYMGSKMVDFHADCGDEFYLVLSKPHTGKILLAYNTKMFDYQPPQV